MVNDQRMKLDAAVNDVKNFQFDSNHFWNDKSTASKILAAISMGLGAYGASMTGGKNYAMEIINDAINRDTEMQKLKFEKSKFGVSVAQTGLQTMYDQFNNEDKANLGLRISQLEMVKSKIDTLSAQSKSAEIKNNAQMLKAEVTQKQAQMMESFDKISWDKSIDLMKLQVEGAKVKQGMMGTYVPGLKGHATTPEIAKGLIDDDARLRTLIKNVNEIKQLKSDAKFGRLPLNKARTAAAAIASSMKFNMVKFNDANLRGAATDYIEKMIPGDPLEVDLFGQDIEGKLDTLPRIMARQFKAGAEAAGLNPAYYDLSDMDQGESTYALGETKALPGGKTAQEIAPGKWKRGQ
jgi:hypothetical protein